MQFRQSSCIITFQLVILFQKITYNRECTVCLTRDIFHVHRGIFSIVYSLIHFVYVYLEHVMMMSLSHMVVHVGLEWTNPDIRPNYNAEGSWDLNSEDVDPMPSGEKGMSAHT